MPRNRSEPLIYRAFIHFRELRKRTFRGTISRTLIRPVLGIGIGLINIQMKSLRMLGGELGNCGLTADVEC